MQTSVPGHARKHACRTRTIDRTSSAARTASASARPDSASAACADPSPASSPQQRAAAVRAVPPSSGPSSQRASPCRVRRQHMLCRNAGLTLVMHQPCPTQNSAHRGTMPSSSKLVKACLCHDRVQTDGGSMTAAAAQAPCQLETSDQQFTSRPGPHHERRLEGGKELLVGDGGGV